MSHRTLLTSANIVVSHSHLEQVYEFTPQEKATIQANALANYPGIQPVHYVHLDHSSEELLPTRRYNCWGFTFNPRQCWINSGTDVQNILNANGTQVFPPNLRIGDVICYRDNENVITHTGRVWSIDASGQASLIQSKWGALGEYFHPPLAVPSIYGTNVTYWRATPLTGKGDAWHKDNAADDRLPYPPGTKRLSPDLWCNNSGGTTHQDPIRGQPNKLYARLHNSDTLPINNATIRFYWADPIVGISHSQWHDIGTVPVSVAPGSSAVTGPVTWIPDASVPAYSSLLAIADTGDEPFTAATLDPIVWPFDVGRDNNIGQRNVYVMSLRKKEMVDCGKAIAKKRGLPTYNRMFNHALFGKLPDQYIISGTGIICEGDDLHFVNNTAMQQMWDDIRRTCIVGLDLGHEVLEKRFNKEVTPDTINYYLEILNHVMPGAAIVQEDMIETNPCLLEDCYVKLFTGDETLQDEIDKQFIINIDNEFPTNQAKQIKAAIGKTTWQAVHIPTIVTRTEDGPGTSRWMAMQSGMTFIRAYHLCGAAAVGELASGGAALGELAYTIKHAALVEMGDMLPARRARGQNEPGGLSFGNMADIIQTNRKTPEDPCNIVLQVGSAASMLYDQIWLGGYMSGGAGFTIYALPAYTNDIADEFLYWGKDYANKKYGGDGKAKANIGTIKDIATEVTLYGLERYEKDWRKLESHFEGSQRATAIAMAAGCSTALATGHSNAALSAWYLSMYLHKEAHGRLGELGYDLQDQCGTANVFSIGSDEGCLAELRGPNYPNYAMTVGHLGGYSSIVAAAHAGRRDAFCVSPLVKVAFADELINFDFADPRGCFGKAALREWDRCAGERDFIIPAK